MPITETAYEKYINCKIHEYQLRSKDILEYKNNAEISCLFCCIIISKAHRDGNGIIALMEEYKKLLANLKSKNIKVKRIVADCVNKDGERFAIREGFKQINKYKDGKIFEIKAYD